ncbi:hypothetical protein RCL1_006859 [Eukaryota sp. TZLM3-RCL]
MASVDDHVQYGPLKKLEVKNCVAYSGITCILGFLLFTFILMLIPGDVPEPPIVSGVISGVVLGPDNLPVENIEVSCPSFETVTTNANGQFSFPEAVFGEYVLTINHPNYEQETVMVVLDAAIVNVEISLSFVTGVISGVVLGPDNLPVENVALLCPSVSTVTTNANGEFSFPEAVYGEYILTVYHPNYNLETVNVVLDASNVDVEISLTFLYGVISGIVVGPDNSPVENIEVSCPSFETVTTNANGEFSFPEAVYGEYGLTFLDPTFNFQPESRTAVIDRPNVGVFVPLSFAPAQLAVDVRFSTSMDPLSSVTVTLKCGFLTQTLASSLNGIASFTNIMFRGECSLELSRNNFNSKTVNTLVNAAQNTEIVTLEPLSGFSVNLVDDSTGLPLHNVEITFSGGGSLYFYNTNVNGNINFSPLPQETSFNLYVNYPGYETLWYVYNFTNEPLLIKLRLVPLE